MNWLQKNSPFVFVIAAFVALGVLVKFLFPTVPMVSETLRKQTTSQVIVDVPKSNPQITSTPVQQPLLAKAGTAIPVMQNETLVECLDIHRYSCNFKHGPQPPALCVKSVPQGLDGCVSIEASSPITDLESPRDPNDTDEKDPLDNFNFVCTTFPTSGVIEFGGNSAFEALQQTVANCLSQFPDKNGTQYQLQLAPAH